MGNRACRSEEIIFIICIEGTRRYQFNTINGKKGGRKWEIVTLKNLETGELQGFKSKSECSRWLRDEFGLSTREFNKFMKGQGKICDKFILMDWGQFV